MTKSAGGGGKQGSGKFWVITLDLEGSTGIYWWEVGGGGFRQRKRHRDKERELKQRGVNRSKLWVKQLYQKMSN